MNRIVVLRLFNLLVCAAFFPFSVLHAQTVFTHADSLLGSLNAERSWFNVLRYDLDITPDFTQRSIYGVNKITYAGVGGAFMQIDLKEPLMIDSILQDGHKLSFQREGNAFHVQMPAAVAGSVDVAAARSVSVFYHGHPTVAANPPWDGGWIFTSDKQGRPWMTVACEEDGASIWYPCKDYLGDEPDSGAGITIHVPDTLVAVANGRLISRTEQPDHMTTYTWAVRSPINNYNIVPYIGKYVHWHEDYAGKKGPLDMDFWVMDYDLARAKKQFLGVDSMMKVFEYWFGPYPFYADGYKLVQSPHLGMEHQSAIAYGNDFLRGYHGKDLSGSGWGTKWDFIVVHESGHEWFGNNITSKDLADEWIHESFTTYSETLYAGYWFGEEAASAYITGQRKMIKNKLPIIGAYGVHRGPEDTDEYYKGTNMLHIIRQLVGNDSLFRKMLTGLNETFYHQTVTTAQIEQYLIKKSGKPLGPVFDQYLRTIRIPVLEYRQHGYTLSYRWSNCVPGFRMPVRVNFKGNRWITPSTKWKTISMYPEGDASFSADPEFYISVKKIP